MKVRIEKDIGNYSKLFLSLTDGDLFVKIEKWCSNREMVVALQTKNEKRKCKFKQLNSKHKPLQAVDLSHRTNKSLSLSLNFGTVPR